MGSVAIAFNVILRASKNQAMAFMAAWLYVLQQCHACASILSLSGSGVLCILMLLLGPNPYHR